MYQPVTDRAGMVVGYQYVDASGQRQFVPAVGAQQQPGPAGGRLAGLAQRQRFGGPQFGAGPSAAPSPVAAPAAPQFMFGGNTPTPPAAPAGPSAMGGQERSGGGGSPLYQKLYGKFQGIGQELRGNVEAMAAGEPLGPTDAAYRAGDRRMTADMRAAERDMQARAKASGLIANPYYAVNGVAEGTLGTATQDWFRNRPLSQLTFLMQGANGNDRFSDNARRFGQAVNRTADQLASGYGPSQTELMAALFNPSRSSALGRSFQMPVAGEAKYDQYGIYRGTRRTQWDWAPATSQAEAMRSYLSAIYGTTTRPSSQQPAMTYVNRMIDQWVAQNLNKNSPAPLYRWLGQQMGY